ncbi:RHS repeat domain-containing protein [Bathymodiolus thermophilus thioautotrophic gill symbiont]|uniref:Insecticidal toxin complex protein n=1 Tax=Bathymodiolus thermophilus thioautotrophic gill symbiont TaxID=2360 RepID=A0A8H9CHF9_9GAMM|nr:RHS repeat-associated core domain-containing protein [Bathymodiolus thermophilus thioautotrophic gill symbiont]CAB5499818.1 hypothetical protein THERMOS_1094 [Bathymodiolus thermophilus thioautotrophic gill symbiont]
MNTLEPYHQTYTYDTSNNLTHLSHQANSNTWQQTIAIHPHNNRGTETPQSTTDFDTNGNLLTLNNIGTLHWHYNNTLNKLTQQDKNNTTEYYVYDHQGNRVRTVIESNKQIQSQRNYLPSLDISTNKAKQQTNTLHIGTHILSETSENNTQTRYQLSSHLKTNTLELNDQAQIISYESYSPYGATTLIAGKNKTQVQQKCYRYTGKERDDSSGLYYYGARYLAPWLARWISPDPAGAVGGLNLYVYVSNNPLKYRDPTGHIKTIPEQEAEEGAVGGAAYNGRTKRQHFDSGEYAVINGEVISANLAAEQMVKMVKIMETKEAILRSAVFNKLGDLESSSRRYHALGSFSDQLPYARSLAERADGKIAMLRAQERKEVADLTRKGLTRIRATMQFHASVEYRKLVMEKHEAANCFECANVMLGSLNKKYPNMPVELINMANVDHVFNLINRDQSTSMFEPNTWNEDTLVVDAWKQVVYTKEEFLLVNLQKNYFGLDNDIEGIVEQQMRHKEDMSSRVFNGPHLETETSLF